MIKKRYNTLPNRPDEVGGTITLCKEAVIRTRLNMQSMYYDNPNLTGLCDIAVDMFCNQATKLYEHYNLGYGHGATTEFNVIYGEIRHNPRTLSEYWESEHVWVRVETEEFGHGNKEIVYVDPTCGQFKGIIKGLDLNYYVGSRPPKWFIPDSKNPYYWCNEKIYKTVVGFLYYTAWGFISDIIHKVKYKD